MAYNAALSEAADKLARILLRKLKEEFQVKHLSKNLIKTIQIEVSTDSVSIHIPAKTYNMLMFQQKGVVIHTSHGSYASKLDTEGSEFYVYPKGTRKGSKLIKPHNHVGYIDKIINEAIKEWKGSLKDTKVSKQEEGN